MNDFDRITADLADVREAGERIIEKHRPFGVDLLVRTVAPRVGELACVRSDDSDVDDMTETWSDVMSGFDMGAADPATREKEIASLY
jgi:hypothetical protein